MIELLANTDIGILLYIQEHIRTPWLTPVVIFITSLGNAGIFWILLSALLLVSKKTRKAGFISFLALFASLLINNLLLKNLVARMRPFDAYQALSQGRPIFPFLPVIRGVLLPRHMCCIKDCRKKRDWRRLCWRF